MLDKWNPTQINIKITSKTSKLNAYVYEGRSRKEAVNSLTSGNEQIKVGKVFSVKPGSGFLIVAYPTDESEEEFGFEFWVDATLKPPAGSENDKTG